jgi:hypothetical protein
MTRAENKLLIEFSGGSRRVDPAAVVGPRSRALREEAMSLRRDQRLQP